MASLDPVRLLEHLHGHIGWLAAAALAHPAVLLRRSTRRAHLSVALAVGFVSVVGALGVAIYGPYRDQLRQSIFIHAPATGWLFERKEHLAFGAIALAWAGALAYFAAGGVDDATRAPLRAFAFRAFVIACVLAIVTAALGTYVAVYRTF
jgi:hypothetical protein